MKYYCGPKLLVTGLLLFVQATGKLYSGLHARDLIKKHFSGAQVLHDVKWKVFVLCKFKSSVRLTNATQVLCQVGIVTYKVVPLVEAGLILLIFVVPL
jgi:hypothetical protein